MKFHLIRHGNKEAIPFDPPLTAIGIKQAEITSSFLKDVKFTEIVASPKLRAQQTAKILAIPHNLKILTDERLIERLEWENGETFDEFIKEWSKTDLDRSYHPGVGDSSIQKGIKMREVLDHLYRKYNDGNVLVVTHGGSIGDLLRNIFGDGAIPEEIDPVTGVNHIKIAECSITTLERNEQDYALLKINDASHLSQPLI